MSFSHVKDVRFSGWALVVSVIGHAALLAVAGLLIADDADAEPAWVIAAPVDPEPGGGGDTFDVETVLDDEPGESTDARGDEDHADGTDDDPGEDPLLPPPEPTPPPEPVAHPAPVPDPEPDPAADPEPEPDPVPDPELATDPAADPDPGPDPDADPTSTPVASATPSTGKPQASPSGKGKGKGQSYGAAELPRGMRHLAPAFTRAIPPAVSGDRAWTRLDLGDAGAVKITVIVNGEGRVAGIETSPEDAELPKHLQRLVKRTTALLKAGRYALTAEPGAAGRETFLIRIALTKRDPIDQAGADPDDALQLGNEPPTLDLPGKAYFTYASGRHFQAEVTILSSEVTAPAKAGDDAADE